MVKRGNGKTEKRVKGGKAEKRVKGGKAEKRVKGGKLCYSNFTISTTTTVHFN